MSNRWIERTTAANAAVGARLADASDALVSTLREANDVVARQGAAGLDYARAFGGDMISGARRAGTSTRGLIAERPVESVVIVALVGVAIGWILRRTRERVAVQPAARARASQGRSNGAKKPRTPSRASASA